MPTIPTQKPVEVQKTYGIWWIPAIGITAPPNGPWRLVCSFRLGRDTGESVIDPNDPNEKPLLDRNGDPVTRIEFLPEELGGKVVSLRIDDLQKLAREKAASGDTRWRDAIDVFIRLCAEYANETGKIT